MVLQSRSGDAVVAWMIRIWGESDHMRLSTLNFKCQAATCRLLLTHKCHQLSHHCYLPARLYVNFGQLICLQETLLILEHHGNLLGAEPLVSCCESSHTQISACVVPQNAKQQPLQRPQRCDVCLFFLTVAVRKHIIIHHQHSIIIISYLVI